MKSEQVVEIISCACGCQRALEKFDWRGRPRAYIHGHNHRGRKRSEATKKRMSKAQQGKYVPPGVGRKISKALIGRSLSEEHKRSIGKGQEGKIVSPKTRAKMKASALVRIREGRFVPPTITEERKEELRQGFTGLNNPRWNGGITSENQRLRHLPEYFDWRQAVFERDDYICSACGSRGGDLEAHHLFPFAQYPELRFEVSNGVTMHKKCHHLYADRVAA